MPTRVLSVGTAEHTIDPNPQRTVLVIQNLDTTLTDYLYVSDEPGRAAVTGTRIAAGGGSITLRRVHGEEPEKAWHIIATTATTPVRVMELFGTPWITEPEEPSPQEPYAPKDAPIMRKKGHIDTGYR